MLISTKSSIIFIYIEFYSLRVFYAAAAAVRTRKLAVGKMATSATDGAYSRVGISDFARNHCAIFAKTRTVAIRTDMNMFRSGDSCATAVWTDGCAVKIERLGANSFIEGRERDGKSQQNGWRFGQ